MNTFVCFIRYITRLKMVDDFIEEKRGGICGIIGDLLARLITRLFGT